MNGQLEAILKAPPGINGNRVFSTTTSAVATASAVITTATGSDPAFIPATGCFITWICDADCYIKVGDSASMAVATSADWFLPAGVEKEYWHFGQTQSYFSVLQKTAAGTLKRYRSSP